MSLPSIELLSPAKVNLRLEVLKKRGDGYHEIRTILQRISLCDTLRISLKGEQGISVSTDSPRLPVKEGNLAYRAASSLLEAAEARIGIDLHIQKKVPISSGLGGGSSNAASTLMGLNGILKLNFSKERLMAIGAGIGADIPFFILEKTAIATGIGEKLEPVEIPSSIWLVLVNPGWEVSTRWAYEGLNFELTKRPIHIKLPLFFNDIGHLTRILHNDLESVTIAAYPEIDGIKGDLLSQGALGSLMTGSGPIVFGLFSHKRRAENAYRKLNSKYGERRWAVYLAKCI
ncbi:MAG: 4-(cytidine 5'-diphospho)-2-C-methyl-D-erythritol kinase [Syntrophobacterales bacterium]|nr:MAG: 4-(cytidine 5'-diphospho)-2-C-methyl-D-erythritol kinase [Syntrophobacterales bacterium]